MKITQIFRRNCVLGYLGLYLVIYRRKITKSYDIKLTHFPGAMKTYWLEGRESRPSLTKVISPQLQPGTELEWERAADVRDSIAEHSAQQLINKEANSARLQNPEAHLPNSIVNSGPNSLVNSLGNLITVQNANAGVRNSQGPTNGPTTMTSPVEERRIYSPVTFQDVARRSIANSPNRTERERGK